MAIANLGNLEMKKVLLGTSALLGVGLLAGTAVASDGVKLSLGGFMRSYFGATWDDDKAGEDGDNHNLTGVGTDAEIYFLGSVTLDNGVTVGARFELEGGRRQIVSGNLGATTASFKDGTPFTLGVLSGLHSPTEVVLWMKPFWFTLLPVTVTLPRSEEMRPLLVAVPP